MASHIRAGAAAGFLAGFVFGVMMKTMTAPTPARGEMSMMAMVRQLLIAARGGRLFIPGGGHLSVAGTRDRQPQTYRLLG